MSELSKTIERLELWADYWRWHQPPEFITDLRALLKAAKAAQRAAELLQGAQRYGLEPVGNYQGESMMSNDYGDWVEFDDVTKAIQILQEGQQ